jgi:hypothetical protein
MPGKSADTSQATGNPRRAMLAGAGAALGVMAAKTLVTGSPAQADQGSAVLEGADNTGATQRTAVFTTGNTEWATLADPNTSGKGSLGVSGHGQDFGVYADTSGNGTGVAGLGAGTGAGLSGTGGPDGGPGVTGTGGGKDGAGVAGLGAGIGAGLSGAGGPGGGPGVAGLGALAGAGLSGTGGPSDGPGVTGTGGGKNGAGVAGLGAGIGAGLSGTGGPSGGPGVAGLGALAGAGLSGTGGPSGGPGVAGLGALAGAGLSGTGGPSGGPGVTGIAGGIGFGIQGVGGGPDGGGGGVLGQSATSTGVHGKTTAATAPGVLAENTGGGPALQVSGPAVFSRSGVMTISAGSSSVIKRNVPMTAESLVLATLQDHVPGVWVASAVPGADGQSFTVYLNVAVKARTRVGWFVVG